MLKMNDIKLYKVFERFKMACRVDDLLNEGKHKIFKGRCSYK